MTNVAAGAQPAMGGITRQSAVIIGIVATLVINSMATLLPINGQTTAEISDRFPLLITPPGYIFSIWGLIYTGLIAYGVFQALPSRRDDSRLQRVAWLFVVSCVANCAWILLWHYNQTALTVPVMVSLLLTLITIDRRIDHGTPLRIDEIICLRLPFSIYLGWISVATIVNLTVMLYDFGWSGFGVAPAIWTALLLAVSAVLSATMGLRKGDAAFALVVAWAASGIAAKNGAIPLVSSMAWVATVVSLLTAGVAIVLFFNRRRRMAR